MDKDFETEISDAPEIKLYFIIDVIGAMNWRLNHDMADGRIPKEDWPVLDKGIVEAHEKQHAAVGQLARFGISPFKEDGKSPNDAYWAWFRTWDNYIKKKLSEEEWNELNRKLSAKEDVSMYKPEV